MRKLRAPVRLYVLAVIGVAIGAFALTPVLPQGGSLDPVLAASLFAVATVANLRVVHVTAKTKITVGGAAVFAGVLTLAPIVAMAIGALSAFIGLTFATKQPIYNRLFNASGTAIAAAAAAWLHRGFARGSGLLDDPLILVISAATYYLVKTSITDIVVALQAWRDPLRSWWPEHRRDVFHHVACTRWGSSRRSPRSVRPGRSRSSSSRWRSSCSRSERRRGCGSTRRTPSSSSPTSSISATRIRTATASASPSTRRASRSTFVCR